MILLIHSYPGANETVKRHWPYFLKAKADEIVGISTIGGGCEWPEGIKSVEIEQNLYLCGPNLPRRLVETVEFGIASGHEHIVIAEYDSLFFDAIPRVSGTWGFTAGGQTFDAKAPFYVHNPWGFDQDTAKRFINDGRTIIEEGHCSYGRCESSPDCFYAYVVDRFCLPYRNDVMTEFSRNDLKHPDDLAAARRARKDGIQVIHGCKTAEELEFITS